MGMTTNSMLATVLNQTFTQQCGKHQYTKNPADPQAMVVTFSVPVDAEKFDGYQTLEVVYWGPQNYVQVWVRYAWNVISVSDLEEGPDGELQVKAGQDYKKGASEWTKVADHDSGWCDGMKSVLRDYPVQGFSGSSFYKLVSAKTLSFVETV